MIKKILLCVSIGCFLVYAESAKVRFKDISKVVESRDNQLIGYGLVVGLRNTGDTQRSAFTEKALTNLLKRMGLTPDKRDFRSRNTASVIVTMNLPPYARVGQKIDVNVASLGDATSLDGGTLLMTPMQGPDFETYAVAQGQVVVGGTSGQSIKSNYVKNQTTAGRVPNGAIVEKEVAVTRPDQLHVHIVLNKPDFTMASKMVHALKFNGFKRVEAVDASSIRVPISGIANMSYVDMVKKIENIMIIPESTSKVVINSKTGTVIIGDNVRLLPVAITHGSISVRIDGAESQDRYTNIVDADKPAEIEVTEASSDLTYVKPDNSLSSLVDALNEVGVSTKELISILQALEESGALVATIDVI